MCAIDHFTSNKFSIFCMHCVPITWVMRKRVDSTSFFRYAENLLSTGLCLCMNLRMIHRLL